METTDGKFYLLAIPDKDRLLRILRYMLDEKEFLSDYGIRSLSKVRTLCHLASLSPCKTVCMHYSFCMLLCIVWEKLLLPAVGSVIKQKSNQKGTVNTF